MTNLSKNINIQVYGNKAQLSIANGFNTTPMTRREIKQLIDDAIKAEHAMYKSEMVDKAFLRVVGQ
jgi:hypothetical protein